MPISLSSFLSNPFSGGTAIDGITIGGTTPAAGTFSTLVTPILSQGATGDLTIDASGSNSIITYTDGSARTIITPYGNFGVGAYPSPWDLEYRAIEIGPGATLTYNQTTNQLFLTNNIYYDGFNWIKSDALIDGGSYYRLTDSNHTWYGWGVGDSNPSQWMQLSQAGAGIGLLSVTGMITTPILANTGTLELATTGANPIVLTTNSVERMRIHSSGGVSIGNANDPGDTNLSVSGSIFEENATSGRADVVGTQTFRLAANGTAFGPAIGDFFGANSSISLEASSVYEIIGYLVFTKTTAGTATWTLTASSAPTRMVADYVGSPIAGISAGTPTIAFTGTQAIATVNFVATGSLSTGVNHTYRFNVQVHTNAATNFRFRLTQSAGTATPLAGSYYSVRKISATTGTYAA